MQDYHRYSLSQSFNIYFISVFALKSLTIYHSFPEHHLANIYLKMNSFWLGTAMKLTKGGSTWEANLEFLTVIKLIYMYNGHLYIAWNSFGRNIFINWFYGSVIMPVSEENQDRIHTSKVKEGSATICQFSKSEYQFDT